jgi:hypothetical protein
LGEILSAWRFFIYGDFKVNRQNVVTVRFRNAEVAKLRDLARKRGVSEGLLLRELIANAKCEPRVVKTWAISTDVQLLEDAGNHAT